MKPDEEDSRGRGILSPADRRYLTTPDIYAEEHSRQSVKERKEAIRQRLRDAVLDFSLLFAHLPDSERQEAFVRHGWQSPKDAGEELERLEEIAEMESAVSDGVALLFLVARDLGSDREHVVEEGVKRAEEHLRPIHAEVLLEIDRQERQELASRGRKKMERGEPLENAEVRALLASEDVPDEEVGEYIRGGGSN